MDLQLELNNRIRELDISIRQLRKSGEDYAKAYTNYRVALAKKLVELKNEGYAITLAGDIARGDPKIARLKFEEIAKEAIYKANLESINATKLAIKIIETQLDREYNFDLPN